VPIQKWLFSPISLLGGNFNPQNITHMPAVKISARLKLDENISFLDGHVLRCADQADRSIPHWLHACAVDALAMPHVSHSQEDAGSSTAFGVIPMQMK
jgi:hypothetical protein